MPDLWENLEELFKAQLIRSHEFVYDEIVPAAGEKDDLAKVVSKLKVCFVSITKRQAQLVPDILAIFPHLIDPMRRRSKLIHGLLPWWSR